MLKAAAVLLAVASWWFLAPPRSITGLHAWLIFMGTTSLIFAVFLWPERLRALHADARARRPETARWRFVLRYGLLQLALDALMISAFAAAMTSGHPDALPDGRWLLLLVPAAGAWVYASGWLAYARAKVEG